MDSKIYIGLDVHQASISAAVLDCAGKLVMECIIETKAATVLDFIQGMRGELRVAFEEGTSAAWLYDLIKPHVAHVIVCDPRKNALLKVGNNDQRSHASDESAQSPVSKLGDSLRRNKSVFTAPP
jgi:hypothetical protein